MIHRSFKQLIHTFSLVFYYMRGEIIDLMNVFCALFNKNERNMGVFVLE